MQYFKILCVAFLVFFLPWFSLYKTNINTLPIQSEDTLPAMFLPVTIIKEHTLYLDTYYSMMLEKYPQPDDKQQFLDKIPFYLRKAYTISPGNISQENRLNQNTYIVNKNYHYVSAFPIMTAILALPIYLIPIILNISITWNNLIILSHLSAAFIMSLSVLAFYILLKKHFISDKYKLNLLTIIYAFGTINFALVSQALWQHGTVQLFVILAVYFLFNALNLDTKNIKKHYDQLFLSGLCFGFAILSRPTSAIVIPIISILLVYKLYFEKYKLIPSIKLFISYILGFIPPALFFYLYNSIFYKNILNQGYANQLTTGWLSKFPEGFLGLWVSPSKGILIYSPVFIFIFISLYLCIREIKKSKTYETNLKYILFGIIVLFHTLILGKWKHWYGGWSFGYRMASDIIPFLVLLLIPFIKSKYFEKYKKIFYTFIVISVVIELYGLIFFDGIWHAAYDKGFVDTAWLWSIKNSEMIFNVRRVLVKLGLLIQACPKCL